jgi:hypothetical protein
MGTGEKLCHQEQPCYPDPELAEGEGPAVRRKKQVLRFAQDDKQ